MIKLFCDLCKAETPKNYANKKLQINHNNATIKLTVTLNPSTSDQVICKECLVKELRLDHSNIEEEVETTIIIPNYQYIPCSSADKIFGPVTITKDDLNVIAFPREFSSGQEIKK